MSTLHTIRRRVRGLDIESFFFLEADRATEPNEADQERLGYIYRKMLAYSFTHKLRIHTKHLGFQEFRVLFVTTSAKRVENMIRENIQVNNGAGSEPFLFTDEPSLCTAKDILKHAWINGSRRTDYSCQLGMVQAQLHF